MPQEISIASLGTAIGSQSAGRVPVDSVSFDLQRILSGFVVIGVEIALLAFICAALYFATTAAISRAATVRGGAPATWSARAKARARTLLLASFFLLVAGLLLYNGWLIARGVDVGTHTVALIRSIDAGTWWAIGVALAKLAIAVGGLVIATRLLRRLLRSAERAINRWDQNKSNDQSLAALVTGLDHVIVNTAWMVLAVIACGWFAAPPSVSAALGVLIRIYLVIAIGIMIVRCAAVIVDTLDGWASRSARGRGWARYYDHLHSLLPTFHACLEYVLWIAMGSLVLLQISPLRHLAPWGPRIIQAIGIFFLGRVIIELGILEIEHRMLPREGLDDMARRRRATMVPLVRSTFTYGAYFGTAVLVLASLGFDPMPFLAGAGILGLVIGFGAQSLINDVVSGFFILFENAYLVGDTVEIAGAKGVVEAIEFRTTKVRDADGRVHIIRNGDTKPLINYSKDYTMAVVAMEVTYDADLREVFNALRQAGQRLLADHRDVLAETDVEGVTAFSKETMTIRTSTRVKPGRHEAVAAALRLLIKETFDRQARGVSRKGLIPRLDEDREPWPQGEKRS
jgi:moderate conductance mechanosensitive channel